MYKGSATKNQRPATKIRTPEEIMVGPLVRVSPEEAAARRLHREQEQRRREAAYVTHVYRAVEGAEDEEEIEVAIDGGSYRAEPDVGVMSGGWTAEGATRIDNGEPIELSEEEREQIELEMAEDEADRCEQAKIDAAEAREDWR